MLLENIKCFIDVIEKKWVGISETLWKLFKMSEKILDSSIFYILEYILFKRI